MFTLPSSGRNKNKKQLSILAHSPNPVLHTSTSDLSPLFSPAEFLELLRRDDATSSSTSSFQQPGTSRLSPYTPSYPSSALQFGSGRSAGEDEPFRFSLEVDASGHASMLPLQLDARSPPLPGGGSVDFLQPGRSLLSPFHMSAFPDVGPPGAQASSPTSPVPETLSRSSSSDSSQAAASQRPDAGPSFIVFPATDFAGLGMQSPALETQSASASPTGLDPSSIHLSRPSLFSHNSAPAVPLQEKESASPRARKAMLKQKRSMSNLRGETSSPVLSTTNEGALDASPHAASPSALAALLPIVPREELPSASKKNHNSNRSANYTPRPPNSWILYRSETIKQMKLAKERGEIFPIPDAVKNHPDVASSEGVMAQADVSKMVALMWKLEGKVVKDKYDQLSAIRKLEHAEMYPGYKYQPARKTPAASTNKAKTSRKAAPPLVMYPSTTPRPPLPSPSGTSSSAGGTSPALDGPSQEPSSGKRKSLKKKKRSRSNLSSRPASPQHPSPSGLPLAPEQGSWPYPQRQPHAWATANPGPSQPWAFPAPVNAMFNAHPQHPLPTPPDYLDQTFHNSRQVWVNPQSPEQQQTYSHGYHDTPPTTAVDSPQGLYPPPAPFNAFPTHASPLDYGSPAHSDAPSASPSFASDVYGYPDFRSQLSPSAPAPSAQQPNFDGVSYTQIISGSITDPNYHAIEVDGQPADVYVAPAAETSLAATWSLLEDDGAVESDPGSAEGASGISWSSQGEWTIDAHHWPAHGQ